MSWNLEVTNGSARCWEKMFSYIAMCFLPFSDPSITPLTPFLHYPPPPTPKLPYHCHSQIISNLPQNFRMPLDCCTACRLALAISRNKEQNNMNNYFNQSQTKKIKVNEVLEILQQQFDVDFCAYHQPRKKFQRQHLLILHGELKGH